MLAKDATSISNAPPVPALAPYILIHSVSAPPADTPLNTIAESSLASVGSVQIVAILLACWAALPEESSRYASIPAPKLAAVVPVEVAVSLCNSATVAVLVESMTVFNAPSPKPILKLVPS